MVKGYNIFLSLIFLDKYSTFDAFSYDYCCSFFDNDFIFFFLKTNILIVCCLKDSQHFIMQSLPQYTSCLFSVSLNDDFVDIEKPYVILSFTFVIDDFSGLFYIYQSFLLKIQDQDK